MALALPNRSLGRAFHWQPVRNTNTMPSNTRRAAFGLRPAPALRVYSLSVGRSRTGTRGSTRAQNSSVTTHEATHFFVTRFFVAIAPLPRRVTGGSGRQYIELRTNSKSVARKCPLWPMRGTSTTLQKLEGRAVFIRTGGNPDVTIPIATLPNEWPRSVSRMTASIEMPSSLGLRLQMPLQTLHFHLRHRFLYSHEKKLACAVHAARCKMWSIDGLR